MAQIFQLFPCFFSVIVDTDSEYSDDYDEEKPTKVDLDSDHATDDQNNDTSNDGAAIEDEKEKPTDFMSELASKLGGPQQKKKDKAVLETCQSQQGWFWCSCICSAPPRDAFIPKVLQDMK